MIPPEVLIRKSLYSLFYEIDLDLAEQTRASRCPFAGVRCTAPTTHENLGVDLLILLRLLKPVLVCAVVVPVAGAASCPHLCVFVGMSSCTTTTLWPWPKSNRNLGRCPATNPCCGACETTAGSKAMGLRSQVAGNNRPLKDSSAVKCAVSKYPTAKRCCTDNLLR